MATGLAARYAASQDPTFQQRVAEAINETAISVYGEDKATPGHARRAQFAVQVFSAPATNAFAQVAAAMGLDSTSTDAAILSAVAASWDALAGA